MEAPLFFLQLFVLAPAAQKPFGAGLSQPGIDALENSRLLLRKLSKHGNRMFSRLLPEIEKGAYLQVRVDKGKDVDLELKCPLQKKLMASSAT